MLIEQIKFSYEVNIFDLISGLSILFSLIVFIFRTWNLFRQLERLLEFNVPAKVNKLFGEVSNLNKRIDRIESFQARSK